MAEPLGTTELRELLSRTDPEARQELLLRVAGNLERLARKMLRSFPSVRRWEGTGDVLQNASMRLLRALNEVRPANMRQFFALAAEQIRRELLDLARHYYGPLGEGANHATANGTALFDAPDPAGEQSQLSDWCEFHEQVARLPDAEREIFDLIYYQGLTQEQAADVLGVDVRTVQRRWQHARLQLHDSLAAPV